MNRRETRYWLFRFKTEAEGGAKATGAPKGLRKFYERQELFKFAGGWLAFGGTWDIDEVDISKVVARSESLWAEWNRHCAQVAKAIPKRKRKVKEVVRPDFQDNLEVDVPLKFH